MMKRVRDGEPVSQEEADAGTSTAAAQDSDSSAVTDTQTADGAVQQ